MSDIDLTEAVEAAHIFTSTSRAHGRGFIENVASCSCGRSFDWTTRQAEHRSHVQAEVVLAVRAQVAREIEADAELTERAAKSWRESERDPNNTTAGADFDRINAEHRESFAKNLRALATRVRHGGAA